MAIASRILKRNTISGTETEVELRGSVHRTVISKVRTVKEILNVLSLGEIVPLGSRSDLNPKKVAKRVQVRHVKLLMKGGDLEVISNIIKIITYDKHIIH